MVWTSVQANLWMLGGDEALQNATEKILGTIWSPTEADLVNKQLMNWVHHLSSVSSILTSFSLDKAVDDRQLLLCLCLLCFEHVKHIHGQSRRPEG